MKFCNLSFLAKIPFVYIWIKSCAPEIKEKQVVAENTVARKMFFELKLTVAAYGF